MGGHRLPVTALLSPVYPIPSALFRMVILAMVLRRADHRNPLKLSAAHVNPTAIRWRRRSHRMLNQVWQGWLCLMRRLRADPL